MPIIFDEINRSFDLIAKDTQYSFYIDQMGYLCHAYFGKKLAKLNIDTFMQLTKRAYGSNISLDLIPQEYPSYGSTDFRSPAFQIQLEDGSTISDLRYRAHKIYAGKPAIDGLPSTYVEKMSEAQTIEIYMYDELAKLEVTLFYTVFEDFNAITRSVKFKNIGNMDIRILRVLSANIDFLGDNFLMLQLSGAWARERHVFLRDIVPGIQSIESRRGASSHQQNPFIALMTDESDEWHGDVYGFNLIYSGNFLAQVEVDFYHNTRVSIGINPFDFSWLLRSGESFQAPETVIVYSDTGLDGMSNTYHKLYRTRLARGRYRDAERPVLINNWEATYFNFDEKKLLEIAREAKETGIELFVLDDGWFGKRNSDNSSLGDWYVNTEKLPNGLDGLVKKINELGLKLGLWIEPEMISPDSELYRAHPDWCIHVPGRARHTMRNQLILDLSRDDVCNYVINTITKLLKSADISYVKWDMNRNMTETGSAKLPPERQRETAHRYILNLYKIMEEITGRFPDILFEGCAGGGGRFDPGMLYYMPQIWASDDTDAVERLKIQWGTSIVYPQIMMGSHVSAIPNHQVGRITPIEMRLSVAMAANFGFELDLSKLSEHDKASIKASIENYKEMRKIIQFGEFHRLLDPFKGNETAWIISSEDKREFLLYYYRILNGPNEFPRILKIKGIDTSLQYLLTDTDTVYGGDELTFRGIILPQIERDFQSFIMHFKAI